MKQRLFIKGRLQCLSPLAIGNGLSERTDKDVLVDVDGKPYIPGSTLAGICRHYLASQQITVSSLFGANVTGDCTDSRITFYNAEADRTADYRIDRRDGVRIDDRGVAEDGGKFDYQIVDFSAQKGGGFCFRLEVEDYDPTTDKKLLYAILQGFRSGEIRIGGKANRGFGRVDPRDVCCYLPQTVQQLIDFTWDAVTVPLPQAMPSDTDDTTPCFTFSREFRLQSFVMVANNATDQKRSDGNAVNAESLKNAAGVPVIPGTSWAGVFRHHFKRILLESGAKEGTEADRYLDVLFGSTAAASKIVFDESVVTNAKCMLQTRNAIDRFTGGACDKKLFCNQLVFGGETTVSGFIKSGLTDTDAALARNLVNLAFDDLQDGTLHIGGMGSVGGGILAEVRDKS